MQNLIRNLSTNKLLIYPDMGSQVATKQNCRYVCSSRTHTAILYFQQ